MTLLRSLLFALYFWALSAAMTLAYLPVLLFGPRRIIVAGMRRWAGRVLWGLRAIAGTGLEVRGREHIPQGGALLAAKHLSMWETIAFHILLDDPAMVMKRELLFVPLYGQYARKAHMIVVDRKGGSRALKRLLADAKARLAEGRQIVIFPEGTRRRPGAVPDYKPGIAALYGALGVPCVPVALNSGLFWPRRGLLRRPGTILIEFLPPIAPGLPREAFMAALEARIETATARLLAEAPPGPSPAAAATAPGGS